MLVLSRTKDEAIHIGNDIKIVVVEVRGDKVRLGIEAPGEREIWRGELYDKLYLGDIGHGLRRGSDSKPAPRSVRAGDEAND